MLSTIKSEQQLRRLLIFAVIEDMLPKDVKLVEICQKYFIVLL